MDVISIPTAGPRSRSLGRFASQSNALALIYLNDQGHLWTD
jgi:hypothetical protein